MSITNKSIYVKIKNFKTDSIYTITINYLNAKDARKTPCILRCDFIYGNLFYSLFLASLTI